MCTFQCVRHERRPHPPIVRTTLPADEPVGRGGSGSGSGGGGSSGGHGALYGSTPPHPRASPGPVVPAHSREEVAIMRRNSEDESWSGDRARHRPTPPPSRYDDYEESTDGGGGVGGGREGLFGRGGGGGGYSGPVDVSPVHTEPRGPATPTTTKSAVRSWGGTQGCSCVHGKNTHHAVGCHESLQRRGWVETLPPAFHDSALSRTPPHPSALSTCSTLRRKWRRRSSVKRLKSGDR